MIEADPRDNTPHTCTSANNIITFPGRNPAPLGKPSFASVRTSPQPPGGAPELEEMQPTGHRRYASMLTYTFRSYGVIVQSSHAELVRDVRCDLPKAATKLRKIRQQIQRDRENAAEREALMTKAEAKLAAAIAAAHDGQLASGADAAPRTKAEERREFREAMRQRIREVAAILKLSEEQIEWPLTLRHREIGRFCLVHGVQLEWLLEGRGRTFKDDPIEVGPNMTGAEFAEVVRTLPIADQQAIAAKLRQFAERRQ